MGVYPAMPPEDAGAIDPLLAAAAEGDKAAWGTLLDCHRDRLRRMVALRLDQRLQGRIDPSDVIQEAYLEASVRLPEYLRNPAMPFFLWLRFLTRQKLLVLHRFHLEAEKRDAGREVPLSQNARAETDSAILAAQLLARQPRPSEEAVRAEIKVRLQAALDRMEPLDREVLSLRHFEQLSNTETAQALGLGESAASKRYVRALRKLREILLGVPGGEEFWQ
jgi:RNA polymerase sigma-70 factor (ECF subfamily)